MEPVVWRSGERVADVITLRTEHATLRMVVPTERPMAIRARRTGPRRRNERRGGRRPVAKWSMVDGGDALQDDE